MIKSQRELFDTERAALEKERAALQKSGKDQSEELDKLTKRIAALDEFKRAAEVAKEKEAQMMVMLNQAAKDAYDSAKDAYGIAATGMIDTANNVTASDRSEWNTEAIEMIETAKVIKPRRKK
jgi:hypothetical protein